MFCCLFSIFHHAIKNVSLIENTDQMFSKFGVKDKQKSPPLWQFSHVFGLVFRSSEFHFISSYSPVSQKNIFISSYTTENNYFLLYELIQDLPYFN